MPEHGPTETNTILLYVESPAESARFYARLFDRPPVEASPTFALFILPTGLALGLWKREGVIPAPIAAGGGSELGFRVASAADVDARHAQWQARNATILLAPTDLEFGRSFVAADPDGHRLRVFAMAEAA